MVRSFKGIEYANLFPCLEPEAFPQGGGYYDASLVVYANNNRIEVHDDAIPWIGVLAQTFVFLCSYVIHLDKWNRSGTVLKRKWEGEILTTAREPTPLLKALIGLFEYRAQALHYPRKWSMARAVWRSHTSLWSLWEGFDSPHGH